MNANTVGIQCPWLGLASRLSRAREESKNGAMTLPAGKVLLVRKRKSIGPTFYFPRALREDSRVVDESEVDAVTEHLRMAKLVSEEAYQQEFDKLARYV